MCIVPLDAAVGAAVVMAVAGLPPYGVGCSCATVEVVSRQLPRCNRRSLPTVVVEVMPAAPVTVGSLPSEAVAAARGASEWGAPLGAW